MRAMSSSSWSRSTTTRGVADVKVFQALVGPDADFSLRIRWDETPEGHEASIVAEMECDALRVSTIDMPMYRLEVFLRPLRGADAPSAPGQASPSQPIDSAPAPAPSRAAEGPQR